MTSRPQFETLKRMLSERIVVIDGALGTSIQDLRLSASDFGGSALDGCNENLVRTRPGLISEIHRGFLAAGADVVETNSFGANAVVLAEFGLQSEARNLNRCAAVLARQAADAFSTPDWPRFVAGAMGPTTKSVSLTGGVSFDALVAAYREQAEGLIEGGADVLLLETVQDTLNAKASLIGIDQAMNNLGVTIGVALQGTIEATGTLLAGQDIEAFYASIAHRDLLWVGLNCATGPDFMTDHIRTLARISRFPVACVPNAGMPDDDGRYSETPAIFTAKIERFLESGWLNLAGGCCGTKPEHIRLLAQAARRHRRRTEISEAGDTVVSGIEALAIDEDTRPVIVGERTNVLGSRRFKRQIAAGKFDEAAEVGRAQIRRGAHMLDVCLQDPDRDEGLDLSRFLDVLTKKVKSPIMIDSTDYRAIELALKRIQGKSIINSINLEEGDNGERLLKVIELAKRYGAAIVVGCIDEDKEQAQAITRQRKLDVATRAYGVLTGRFGISPEDIIFDPLVFPIGTGDENYAGSAVETIEGIRTIKAALPRCKTILGVSNVSFGLPESGRVVLNAVMLYHCVQAGLDMAIVNAEKLVPYSTIAENERLLAENLIWRRGEDPISAFAGYFRERPAAVSLRNDRKALPLDERLALCVVEGTREGLFSDLDLALKTRRPLEIINGPLMRGMDRVGRLFNARQMIVAEVLQSAEAMKAAVSHLEPHMEKDESANRGTVLLATVKGDVHDIGKNLVDIILSNNGYRVVNLGIKVPPDELIRACRSHKPDFVGLSGLLVKSAQMMVETVRDLKAAGISCPILVGGAALTERFVRTRIAPEYDGIVAYADDAMSGLDLANQMMDSKRRSELAELLDRETARLHSAVNGSAHGSSVANGVAREIVRHGEDIPTPPDLERHVISHYDLDEIFSYVNPVMLYTRHLGLRDAERALDSGDARAVRLRAIVDEVKAEMRSRDDIKANAVYQFFRADSQDRQLLIYDHGGKACLEEFTFGRQSDPPNLCLADFVAPHQGGGRDYVCMFATTIGPGVRALAEQWKLEGEYLRSHVLQVLALEGAEAFAELLHRKIREMWGIGDPSGMTHKQLFQSKYRGKRFSFGYPACPRLEDQAKMFRLIDPERTIGVRLTEGFMMEPEGSVSALVIHHPAARYFALSQNDTEKLARELEGAEQPRIAEPPSRLLQTLDEI